MGRPPKPTGFFADIPTIIRKEGRVKGFERMRDKVCEQWEFMKGQMNPYSALKAILEIDRHAMFAGVDELRTKGQFDNELAYGLSDYLKGKTDLAPDATGEMVSIPTPTSRVDITGINDLIDEHTSDDHEEEPEN